MGVAGAEVKHQSRTMVHLVFKRSSSALWVYCSSSYVCSEVSCWGTEMLSAAGQVGVAGYSAVNKGFISGRGFSV